MKGVVLKKLFIFIYKDFYKSTTRPNWGSKNWDDMICDAIFNFEQRQQTQNPFILVQHLIVYRNDKHLPQHIQIYMRKRFYISFYCCVF